MSAYVIIEYDVHVHFWHSFFILHFLSQSIFSILLNFVCLFLFVVNDSSLLLLEGTWG